jgi:cytochrome P450
MLAELVNQLKSGTMTMDDVIGIIKNILGGGTNTVSSTFENFVQLVCNHPAVMKKLQDELDAVVGPDRLVNEDDLPNLKVGWAGEPRWYCLYFCSNLPLSARRHHSTFGRCEDGRSR